MSDNYDEESLGVTMEEGEASGDKTPSPKDAVTDRMQPQTKPDKTSQQSKEEAKEETTDGETTDAETTDRGTKVAKEPESRFYQQLKNENADMRRVLSDQTALKEYLRTMEGTQAPKDEKQDDLADIGEKVLTPEGQLDLVKFGKYMDERVASKIDAGIKYGVENRIKAERVMNSFEADKIAVRSAHPELDPENKDKFDPELDQLIGERFIAQGGYQGKATLKQVTEQTYKDIAKWQGSGKKQAETEIVRKRAGAIPKQKVSGETQDNEETDEMRPEEVLASRVRKSITGR
jgi:hypothetical protein